MMPTLTLKQIPPELLDRLREEAKRNRRSLNQQAIWFLERAVAQKRPSFMEALQAFYDEAGFPKEGDAEALGDGRSPESGREVEL